MVDFGKAVRSKLRFNSSVGLIATEDLWDLSLEQLNALAKGLNKKLKEAEEEDFLKEDSKEDEVAKLKFEVVLEVLNTKKAEKEARVTRAEKKAEREKLLEILAKKQDASLENMSEEDLRKKLEALED